MLNSPQYDSEIDNILNNLVQLNSLPAAGERISTNRKVVEAKQAIQMLIQEAQIEILNDIVLSAEIDELNSPVGTYIKRRKLELQQLTKGEDSE